MYIVPIYSIKLVTIYIYKYERTRHITFVQSTGTKPFVSFLLYCVYTHIYIQHIYI